VVGGGSVGCICQEWYYYQQVRVNSIQSWLQPNGYKDRWQQLKEYREKNKEKKIAEQNKIHNNKDHDNKTH
jgi:hypothetical protein